MQATLNAYFRSRSSMQDECCEVASGKDGIYVSSLCYTILSLTNKLIELGYWVSQIFLILDHKCSQVLIYTQLTMVSEHSCNCVGRLAQSCEAVPYDFNYDILVIPNQLFSIGPIILVSKVIKGWRRGGNCTAASGAG